MKMFNTEQEAKDYSRNNPLETVEFKSYHDNGQLEEHCFFVNGLYHGEYKVFFYDGQLEYHCFYVNGNIHGEFLSYYSNGQLDERCFFVNDEELDFDHLKDGSYKSRCILSTLFYGNLIDEYI